MGSEQWQQRRQQQERHLEAASRRERGRNIMWWSTISGQSIERAGLDGILVLLLLGLCAGGFVLLAYLVYWLSKLSLHCGRLFFFLLRMTVAAIAGTSNRQPARTRGRRSMQKLAVRLRDRPMGLLHGGGTIARITCWFGERVAEAARASEDFSQFEARDWQDKLRRTVGICVEPYCRLPPSESPAAGGQTHRQDQTADFELSRGVSRPPSTASGLPAVALASTSEGDFDTLLDQDVTEFDGHHL
ncbi:MAG: hypothetical protein ACREDR_18435, partial [Blastocatellia bacterium]